jgi:D-arabinose 1-dehydrogenase-like Zn-dependent alcohol dehydrogenase
VVVRNIQWLRTTAKDMLPEIRRVISLQSNFNAGKVWYHMGCLYIHILFLYVLILIVVGDDDVHMKILYCGMCHSDIHQIRGEWSNSMYPMIPGHEITGIVEKVGKNVTKFKEGDKAAVGCMVNSCGSCKQCSVHHCEQFCPKAVWTYNSKDVDGSVTMGGYSTHVVVNEKFVLQFPDNLPMDAGAPLLCAGITTWSPMKHYGLDKEGMRIGIVGLGGLGHMAVKLAKAFGMHVTVISTSGGKKADALENLGADAFLVSTDAEAMASAQGTLDGIIDTVAMKHDFNIYCSLLDTNGKYVVVGLQPEPIELASFSLVFKRIAFGGSLIGGIKETQEMLDFCGEKNIVADIEKISMDYVNTANERMIRGDVKYRFVLDLSTCC